MNNGGGGGGSDYRFALSGARRVVVYGYTVASSSASAELEREFRVSGDIIGKPAWSPAGNRIAFSYDDDYVRSAVGIYDVETGVLQQEFEGLDPDWNKTGAALVAGNRNGYVVYDLGSPSGPESYFGEAVRTPRWDPTGRSRFAMKTGFSGTTLMVQSHLTNMDYKFGIANDVFAYSWAPTGDKIAFNSGSTGAPGSCALSTATMTEMNLSSMRLLVTDTMCDGPMAWSPDGRAIAFSTGVELFVLSLSNATSPVSVWSLTPLVTADWQIKDIQWTKDNRYIAYSTGDFGRLDLKLVNYSTNNQSLLIQQIYGSGEFSAYP